MFVSSGQFYCFAECLFIGAVAGIISEILLILVPAVLRFSVVSQIVWFLRYAIVAVTYYFLSFYYRFPSFRLYMPAGVILGNTLEYATVHKTLAKSVEICYNKIVKYLRSKWNDRKKNEKTRNRGYGTRRGRAFLSDNRTRVAGGCVVLEKARGRKKTRGIRRTFGKE